MFVIRYNATNPGLRKVGVVTKTDDTDVLSIMDLYCPYSLTDAVWIPPCCWADHE